VPAGAGSTRSSLLLYWSKHFAATGSVEEQHCHLLLLLVVHTGRLRCRESRFAFVADRLVGHRQAIVTMLARERRATPASALAEPGAGQRRRSARLWLPIPDATSSWRRGGWRQPGGVYEPLNLGLAP
jgi:hypothetical protein